MAATRCFEAVKEGNLAQLQAIVEEENRAGNDVVNAVNEEGSSLLHVATLHRHLAIVKWILSDESGGFKMILAKDKWGRTVLHMAVENQDLEVCKEIAHMCCIKSGERLRSLLLSAQDKIFWTILHVAAFRRSKTIISWLLSDDGGRLFGLTSQNILARVNNGKTALHIAADTGDLEVCQAIVDGCKVENGERAELLNAVDLYKQTVLHFTVRNRHLPLVEWLLSDDGGRSAGFNGVSYKTAYELTAFHEAAKTGSVAICKALANGSKVENGERLDLLNSVDKEGRTALHIAAEKGEIPLISWLLSDEEDGGRALGFDNVCQKMANGATAFHIAIKCRRLDVAQAIANGSRVGSGERAELLNAVGEKEWTALHCAVDSGELPTVTWLLSNEPGGGRALGFSDVLCKDTNGRTALHLAATASVCSFAEEIVKHCNSPESEELLNAVDEDLMTILHHASRHGQWSMMLWILSDEGGRGAGFKSVLDKTKEGKTALHLVVENDHPEVVPTLVSGCKIENGEREELLNATDNDGWNVLHSAVFHRRSSVVSWLLSNDGGRAAGFKSESISALTKKDSYSPLHLSCIKYDTEYARILLSSCSPVERTNLFLRVDKNGSTALHRAVESCAVEALQEALCYPEARLIVDIHDLQGMTVLSQIVFQGLTNERKCTFDWEFFKRSTPRYRLEMATVLLGQQKEQSTVVSADPNVASSMAFSFGADDEVDSEEEY